MAKYIFLFLIIAEYGGLAYYIPIYGKLPITLGLSALLLIYVVSKFKVSEAFKHQATNYTLVFTLLTGLAMVHGFVKSYALEPFKIQIGYFIFTIISAYLFSDKKSFKLFALVFSVLHVVLIIINLQKLGAERIGRYQAGFFLGDGNDFSWSLNLVLPLTFLLVFTTKKVIFQYAYIGLAAIILIGIIGTQSRGATIALAAGLLYYLLFISTQKAAGFSLIGIIVVGILMFSPANYLSRMGTVADYEEDTSAMGRIKAWNNAYEMALDNPILGVGAGSFNSAYGRKYRKGDDPVRWISAHSVYFKVMAEYGFTGLLLYILSIWHTISINIKTLKLVRDNQSKIEVKPIWPQCMIWSTISWLVCAIFLTGYLYPHLFLLMGLSIALYRMVKHEIEVSVETESPEIKTKPARPRYFS
jgi:probable O-glycosylation ligase (exosortase A-associated)